MNKEYEKFLKKVAEDAGIDLNHKKAFLNPMENEMYAKLVGGALKGLNVVALATFDFKLVAIHKLLQVWYDGKVEEAQKAKIQREYGADAWEEYKQNPSQFDNNYGGYDYYGNY